jgi:hypothetical protein
MALRAGENDVDEFLTPLAPFLIPRPLCAVAAWSSARMELDVTQDEKPMTDLIYIGITVLFFVVGGLYVRFCEKL